MLTAEGDTARGRPFSPTASPVPPSLPAWGADARVSGDGRLLRIRGVSGLHGDRLEAKDLRGGAALVIASLAAQGESEITGVEFIRRGYEDIAGLFRGLGAQVGSGQQGAAPLRETVRLAQ